MKVSYEQVENLSPEDILLTQLAMAIDFTISKSDRDQLIPALRRIMKEAHLEDVLDYPKIKEGDFQYETSLEVAKRIMEERGDELRSIGLDILNNVAYRMYLNIQEAERMKRAGYVPVTQIELFRDL